MTKPLASAGMSGTDGIRLLKQRYPGLPALVLTVYEDDERIFNALCAGACGYLLKSTPPARLLEGLQEAVAGGAPMSPTVARRKNRIAMEKASFVSPPIPSGCGEERTKLLLP